MRERERDTLASTFLQTPSSIALLRYFLPGGRLLGVWPQGPVSSEQYLLKSGKIIAL
jgi:hypothetical protein